MTFTAIEEAIYDMNIPTANFTFIRIVLIPLCWLTLSLSGCGQEQATPGKTGSGAAQEQAPAVSEPTRAPEPAAPQSAGKGLILVTGITGQQGGAVAEELLKRGYPLRGLTREMNKPEAQALASRGIEMVQGDFSDPASIQAAVAGAYGIFLNTPNGTDEVNQGKTVIDTARVAGITHIVYSTYTSADPVHGRPGMPKAEVESYLRDSGIGYTILRPVTFMENFGRTKSAILKDGIHDPRKPETKMLYISVNDIGFFVGEAFDNPKDWLGREQNIASDSFTNPELADMISRVSGVPVKFTQISWEEWGKQTPPYIVDLYKWYETSGFSVDIAGLRQQYPNLYTMERYLRENGWGNPETGAETNEGPE